MFSYGESPMAGDVPEKSHDAIMHAYLVADGAEIMAADGPPPAGTGASASRSSACRRGWRGDRPGRRRERSGS